MAMLILLGKDCKLDKKHKDHIKARWEVWTKGYGLYCDMNGKLYVYAPESARPKG